MGGGVKMGKSQLSGITVEIGGDTSGLDKALKSVNVQANSLKKEMKDVQSSLKVNPENVTLLAQQSQIAAKQIQIASDKLNILKSVEKQVEEQFQNGDIGEQEYRAFQREVINAESTLKDLQKQQENLQNTNNSTTDSVENLAETEEDVVKNTDEASDNIEDLAETEEKAEDKTSSFKDTMTKLGAGLADFAKSAASLAISAVKELSELMKSSIDVGKEFESSMSQVAATMGITANSADFETLEKAAKEMGATTAFSASEAAEALNYLALAGYNAEKAATALPTVLSLAGAGGMDLASASDLITDAMAALQIEIDSNGASLTEFADKMAKTAQKSNTSVSQLGEAILTVGGTASKMAGGTTELNTALGVLANVGIKGSEGGTHLRNMLLSLQSPTDAAAASLEELGVKVYDAKGNLRSIDKIFQDLQKGMKGMSNAEIDNTLSTIFNKTDLAAAQAMLKSCGAEFQNLAAEIDKSSGACEDMYKTMLDNLDGDISIFQSSLSALGIEVYESISDNLRRIVQEAKSMIDELNKAFQKGGFEGLASKVGDILSEIINKITQFIPQAADMVINLVSAFIDGILNNLNSISTRLIQAVKTIINAVVDILPDLISTVINLLSDLVPQILETVLQLILRNLKSILKTISKTLVQIIDILKDILPDVIKTLTDFLPKLINVIIDFIQENLPVIIESGVTLFTSLLGDIDTIIVNLLDILSKILESIVDALINAIPIMVQAGIDLLSALTDALPTIIQNIIEKIPAIIDSIVKELTRLLPVIVQAGVDLLSALVEDLPTIILTIVNAIPDIVEAVVDALIDNLPLLIDCGVELFTSLIENLPEIIEQIILAVPDIIAGIVEAFGRIQYKIVELGVNIGRGIWEGIKSMKDWIVDKISGFCNDIWTSIKDFFGIHSPSTLMRDSIGNNLALGIAEGFTDTMQTVSDEMANAIPTSFDITPQINSSDYFNDNNSQGIESGYNFVINIDNFNNYSNENIEELMDYASQYFANQFQRQGVVF